MNQPSVMMAREIGILEKMKLVLKVKDLG